MKRYIPLLVAIAPLLMCFQCGCNEPDTINTLRLENATGEVLYWSRSDQPWANAECRWTRLPCSLYAHHGGTMPADMFRYYIGSKHLLIVDADMNLRGSWPTDSLPMSDSTRWLSDTTRLETTTCNGIHPTQYTHTFTLTEEDLL